MMTPRLLSAWKMQGVDQHVEVGGDLDDLVPQVETDIQRHLVVAGAAGVQTLPRLADLRRQPRLDVHVDVFQGNGEIELAGLDLLRGSLQPVFNGIHIGHGG